MQPVTESFWRELVEAHRQAERATDAAYEVYANEPLPDNDEAQSEAERRYEKLRAVSDDLERKILGVVSPSAAGAAYQLRLFALSHHGVDVDGPPSADEDREGAILRVIYKGLLGPA